MPLLGESPGRRRRPALWAVVCLLSTSWPSGSGAAPGPSAPSRLSLGVPLERALAGGESTSFRVALTAGRSYRVQADQRGIDVVLEAKDGRGRSLLVVDTPLGREGAESLVLQPEADGEHELEARCEKTGVPAGGVVLRVDELPEATAEDRSRARAERARGEAGRLFAADRTGTAGEALERLAEALETWRALGDGRAQAEILFLIGKFSELLDDYRRAAASYEEAASLWRQLGDRAGLAAALGALGLADKSLGENRRAIDFLKEALALRQQLGQREREAEARNHLCLILQKIGDWPAAGECYGSALELAHQLGDTELVARVLNNLGGIHDNLGEPELALDSYRRALELRRTTADPLGEAATLNNLGALHSELGEVDEALLLYSQALALFEQLGNRYWQARTLNNIGSAYLGLGELERARAYLLRALPLRRQVGDRSGEAVTLRNLGRALFRLGETGKALAFYRKALERSLELGNRRGATATRKLLGELHAAAGDTEQALEELSLALEDLQQMGQRGEQAKVLELQSGVRLAAGDAVEAKRLGAQALDLARAVRDPMSEVAALTAIARAERDLGRPRLMRDRLEAALATLESVHGGLGDASRRASLLATQRETFELFVDALMRLHHQAPREGHQLAALEASERARARSLLGMLASAGADLGQVSEPMRERLRAAQRRFAAKNLRQLRLLGGEHTPRQALVAEQELYAALTALENVRAEIRRSSPRSPLAPRLLKAAEIRALLDPDTVLLELFLGPERSYLWWLTASTVAVFELAARAEIERLAERVHRLTSSAERRPAATRRALEDLGTLLLGPVADRLRHQRLVFVADGALHLVPFAALTSPASRRPLLVDHEVVSLPSASVLPLLRREPAAATGTVAIFADPIFDRADPRITSTPSQAAAPAPAGVFEAADRGPGDGSRFGLDPLERLLHTRHEAEAIAALVPAPQRLLALDGDARRSRVGPELGAYRILHFATHGFIHPRAPELSGLVLSRYDEKGRQLDGFLGLYDVSSLQLSAELVVLSGCRTALGKQVRGEGLVGLTRGFMYAGVPRVVASLWQVRDRSTAELMTRFYRAMLEDGHRPAAALRTAQLSLRQDRRFRDPFYWAAFMLQGDWR